jgi:hypothetical protein
MKSNPERMTASERADLARVVRMRSKIAREDLQAAAAKQLAVAEAQLSRVYDAREKYWADLTKVAQEKLQQLDDELARRCHELGIPPQFRPKLEASWYGRGENANKYRRAELRLVAKARIDAALRIAESKLVRHETELLEQIVRHALTTDAAKTFLDAMPTAEALLPTIDVSDLEKAKALPEINDSGWFHAAEYSR